MFFVFYKNKNVIYWCMLCSLFLSVKLKILQSHQIYKNRLHYWGFFARVLQDRIWWKFSAICLTHSFFKKVTGLKNDVLQNVENQLMTIKPLNIVKRWIFLCLNANVDADFLISEISKCLELSLIEKY